MITRYGLKEKFSEHSPASVVDTFSLSLIQIAETCAMFSTAIIIILFSPNP
jgi:hypothetical protein